MAQRGLGAKVHVTGDGTARLLLDVVERLRAEGHTDAPVQMAHGQFLAADDIGRMVALGVSADISPFLWFPGVIPDALAAVLGADRAEHSQPNRSIIDAGGLVAGGSDWPVSESPDPFEGMQGLVTRADPLGRAPGVLWPEQAITPAEALEVFTINAATAMGLAAETGSLEPGKSADFVIVDRDFVAGAPDDIIITRVLSSLVRRAAGLRRGLTPRAEEGFGCRIRTPPRVFGQCAPASSIRNRAPCSPIRTAGAFVFPVVIRGMTDASITRRPAIPRTRSRPSTTAWASRPMRHVLT